MTASEYYYDCKAEIWDLMYYRDAILDRRDRADALHRKLYMESINRPLTEEAPQELRTRLRKVDKAYRDNKKVSIVLVHHI